MPPGDEGPPSLKETLPGAAAAVAAASAVPAGADEIARRAARLHRDAIVVDTHEDVPWELDEKWADVGLRGATRHFDLPRAKEGGLSAAFFAAYVPAVYADTGGAAKKALDLIDLVHRVVEAHPADLAFAASADDVRRIKREGRMAVLTGIEGGHAIEDSLGALRDFWRLGVRYMTLTHTNTNHWADSSGSFTSPDFDPKKARVHGGLTGFGRAVVLEMNRLGMMVDVSHVSDETIDDVLSVSRAPVFASHSSCRALSPIPRNLTDDQIRRIGAGGGVVMINVSAMFIDGEAAAEYRARIAALATPYEALKAKWGSDPLRLDREANALFDAVPPARADWTKVVDHVERVMRIAGPGAAGLGSDFDGIPDPPDGLEDVSKLPRITEELLRRGHSEEEVRGVLGENFLRFFARVEEAARGLRAETPSTAAIGER